MIKKYAALAWSARGQFTKYFLIGISGVILDISTLYVLKEYFGFRPVYAIIINQTFIINYIFFLNKYWAFKSTGVTHKQMTRFFVIAGGNYLFSIAWMLILNERYFVNYLLARLVNIALAVSWNFLIYKYWVFTGEKIEAI